MNFLIKIAYIAVGWAGLFCAIGAYTSWSVMHSGPIGHSGWAILMLLACITSVAMLYRFHCIADSIALIPGIFPLACLIGGVGVYFVPVLIMFALGTMVGGATLEMLSFELFCGPLAILVLLAGWTGGFGLFE